jgi:hypothetical protein
MLIAPYLHWQLVTYLDLEKLRVGFIFWGESFFSGRNELRFVLDPTLEGFEDIRLNVV